MSGFGRPQNPGTKIVRTRLSDQVLERLQERIASGVLSPGEQMPSEREVMEEFGVGRPAVREAMQRLHDAGLISVSQGGRARVNEIAADTALRSMDAVARMLISGFPNYLDHLKEARIRFELGMVETAAERATADDIAVLRDNIEMQRSKISSPDAQEFIYCDMDFHRQIAEISGNPIYAALSEAILTWLSAYHVHLLRWTGNETTTLDEHAAIVDALEAGSPAKAKAAMKIHLERSADLYRHTD
ncbi:transcriptional regulator, GntR family [Palleronia salina]|uniref:Transcriptional regulator, GntR family n=1 Tax=Palleronia salina TaxID=313368 RepID=A0A1M6H6T0_9RHOB|nr:transcriptional regulator NanR [Palleronia salina]SHJ17905.1 transcriptional regulator, GntR family [Palleronia salina]